MRQPVAHIGSGVGHAGSKHSKGRGIKTGTVEMALAMA